MWARHGKHRTADRPDRHRADRVPTGGESAGFDGLEGGFEEERRRAAASSHERITPYGHDDQPPFPDAKAPLTHP
jgi:hypothetical protein